MGKKVITPEQESSLERDEDARKKRSKEYAKHTAVLMRRARALGKDLDVPIIQIIVKPGCANATIYTTPHFLSLLDTDSQLVRHIQSILQRGCYVKAS
jgi:hypothetical protein